MSGQGYVVGFLVSPSTDEVLLVRKNRPAWQAGRLNGIGGHIEPSEKPWDAMEREFQEETGLRVQPWEHMATMTFPGAAIWFYRCRPAGASVLLGEARTTTDEPIERHRITDLLAPGAAIIPNLRWLLPLAAYEGDDYEPISVRATVAESL